MHLPTRNQDSQTSYSHGLLFQNALLHVLTSVCFPLVSSFSEEDLPYLPHSICMLMRPSDPLPSSCSEVCWIFSPSSNRPVSCIKISIPNVERICSAHCGVIFHCRAGFCVPTSEFALPTTLSYCPQSGVPALRISAPNIVTFLSSLTVWKRPM